MGIWLDDGERRVLAALCDRLVPPDESDGSPGPGATGAGAVDYIDQLLGAFLFDPPRIWAGGPTSGRAGGAAGFGEFLPLSRLDELAWRTRLEGSNGVPQREASGPVVGLQQRYREGLAALGGSFVELTAAEQDTVLHQHREFVDLVYGHVCEALYGPPEYGGNRDLAGWRSIGFAGDVQPRGWSDQEVAGP